MKIYQFSPQAVGRIKKPIIRFMKRYGDGRITSRAIKWFNQQSEDSFKENSLIAAAYDGNKVTGIIVFGNYGIDESFIAVHPDYRQKRVGEQLLKKAIHSLGKVYARVAADNIPSIKLCFACGLVAFSLIKGPTGKPTFWMGGGNFSPEDVIKQKTSATSQACLTEIGENPGNQDKNKVTAHFG
ncbi:MAG: GNAT family N-acetyltransferase [Thermoactinomyces sp.]